MAFQLYYQETYLEKFEASPYCSFIYEKQYPAQSPVRDANKHPSLCKK